MEIPIETLDVRYERLRRRDPRREKRLLASLADGGQQFPILVVAGENGIFIVVDGYKRMRCLKKLGRENVHAARWELAEADAVMLEGLMRDGGGDDPLEQAWRLRELRDRFTLSIPDLARRFDKSVSWVSRRLSLVNALPSAVQEHVRKGAIVAYGAMKYLAPLARANRSDCVRIADGIAPLAPSTRQMRELYVAYMEAGEEARRRIVENPSLFLRAASTPVSQPEILPGAARVLSEDLGQMGGVARRLHRRLRDGVARRVRPHERDDVARCASQSEIDVTDAIKRLRKEFEDAGRDDASGDIHPA
jgi:ParB/RepB/Spo0J family partition protein